MKKEITRSKKGYAQGIGRLRDCNTEAGASMLKEGREMELESGRERRKNKQEMRETAREGGMDEGLSY